MKFTQLAGSLVAATVIGTAAQADKLDDIISSGTLRCAVDQDCPEGAACLVLEGDPTLTPLCFATCAQPEDCYRGSRCTPVEGPLEVMSVCLP